ncbi:hypothetical protein GQ43DRAFT_438265 [Delitschia confertaspora ATCC 74209]|uniref:Regulator of phospholipase D SRF1 n=1 Tax=Delitschia confertaspora ATCC 74209 TaxID=1513339 RepID=A0A9P4JVM9_9PLEO|nr:hypothetical protein GQ43DRAFT_438265 [Delitschia confertaspora ATCC 74209]
MSQLQPLPGRLLPSPIPPPATSPSLSPSRPRSGVSALSSNNGKYIEQSDGVVGRKSVSYSVSSNPHTIASSKGSLTQQSKDKHNAVRTIPPWVHSLDEDEEADPSSLLLPRTPTSVRPASHNHMPTPKPNAVAGRHYDYAREGTPVTISLPVQQHASKWKEFTAATEYPRPPSSRGQIVDDQWMKENLPDLETPWHPMEDENQENDEGFWLLDSSRRKRRLKRIRRTVLNHPMVPLVVRLTVLTFSCLALGLAGSIFRRTGPEGCEKNASTWLALIVDIIAIVYISYITYDEYTSKPLGLRSHNAKMRLIFLDLLFIVFDSANLSLAFQALRDERWVCRENEHELERACSFNDQICQRQKALTATLLIALFAWLITFAISTLRLIEKVAR